MAEFKPNPEQQEFIDSYDRNVLVSASAGSGKTSTMIQKLIRIISDNRVSITELMVVTYTNASASEMKQKLYNEISKLIGESEDDEFKNFLKLQLDNIGNAEIGTLHSICKKLIVKYFYELGQTPDFGVLVDKESKYLLEKTINTVFRNHIVKDDNDFYELYDSYNSKRSDATLKSIVITLYNYINTKNDYNNWKNDFLSSSYNEDLNSNTACNYVMEYYKKYLLTFKKDCEALIQKSRILDLPKYTNFLECRFHFIDEFNSCKDFKQSILILENLSLPNKPIKSKSASVEEIDFDSEVDVFNKAFGEVVRKLKANYSSDSYDKIMITIANARKNLIKLFEIVEEIKNSYSDIKKSKNVLDFNDLEDKMLILLENNQIRSTLQSLYKFVFVDEYQDINNKQEEILSKLVSGNNYYMIGDVKQSIYAFRQSSPKIFISKYNNFQIDIDNNQVINFNTNYRSDRNILEFCNSVFDTLITTDTIGIDYKNTARFQSQKEFDGSKVNITVLDTNDEIDSEEAEALAIADEISHILTRVKSDGQKFTYGDIAIILRQRGTFVETLCKVLTKLQIPVNASINKDFFETSEIQVIISILKCISNYKDDIAIATAIKFLFDVTEEELLKLRYDSTAVSFAQCVQEYSGDDELSRKLSEFFAFIEECRLKLVDNTIYELLVWILEKYNITLRFFSSQGGKEKESNISTFLELSDNDNYKYNLDKFIEYLDFISKETALQSIGNNGNAVQICTIHYSKGLEYPAVILGRLGKKFQINKDSNNIIINERFGVGLKGIDNINRVFDETIVRNACKLDNRKSELNEEIRLLYVAMTRAKEYLTMIGEYDLEKLESNYSKSIYSSNNYFDMIFKSFTKDDIRKFKVSNEFAINESTNSIANVVLCPITQVESKSVDSSEVILNAGDNLLIDTLNQVYLHTPDTNTFTIKNTVTNILREESDYELLNFEPRKLDSSDACVDMDFLAIGTAYHSVMQNLNFNESREDVENLISTLIADGTILAEIANEVSVDEILLAIDNLRDIILNAKSIYKEKQFLLKENYNNIIKNSDNNTKVIIQGVVDLAVVGEKNYLIDYKTNRTNNEEKLKNQYSLQLQIYKIAFEKATGIRIDNTFLYSFYMGKLIEIN